jgi:hypothetical protein
MEKRRTPNAEAAAKENNMDYMISPGELADKAQDISDRCDTIQVVMGETPDELERLDADGDLMNKAMMVYEELDFAMKLAELRIKAIIHEAKMR